MEFLLIKCYNKNILEKGKGNFNDENVIYNQNFTV